jgi:hypothetical protein
MQNPRKTRKWSHKVKAVSTFPPEGIFTKDAKSIARSLASKKISPKGIGSGIRMVQFFNNRAGKNQPDARRRDLENAKQLLQEKAARTKVRIYRTNVPRNKHDRDRFRR